MEQNSDYFKEIFGENYLPNTSNEDEENIQTLTSLDMISERKQREYELQVCPTNEKKIKTVDSSLPQIDFKRIINETSLDISHKKNKKTICFTLDSKNYEFYNRIAENSNITLQRILNLALLCFQEYIQDL